MSLTCRILFFFFFCRILFLKTLPIYIRFTSQKDVAFLLMQYLTKAVSETCHWWGLCFSLAMFWLESVLIHVPSLWGNWKLSLSVQFHNNPRIRQLGINKSLSAKIKNVIWCLRWIKETAGKGREGAQRKWTQNFSMGSKEKEQLYMPK